jgi:hypothetical protein
MHWRWWLTRTHRNNCATAFLVVAAPQLMLEGELYGKVKSFDNGSFWEVVKEGGKLVGGAAPLCKMRICITAL